MPLAELYLLIEVGSGIGGFSTIALCLLTAAIGGMLVRLQGLQTLTEAKQLMDAGQPPAEQMIHGIMIAASGIMLFLPGFITDVIGFMLLIPLFRKIIGRWFFGSIVIQQGRKNETVIEAEVVHPEKHNLP